MNNRPYVVFDPTGRILQTGETHKDALAAMPPNWIEGEGHWDTHYVDVGSLEIREKTPCPAVLDGLKITNVPVPCTITIERSEYEIEDDVVDLEFDVPGTYEVRLRSVPHLDAVFEVVAE